MNHLSLDVFSGFLEGGRRKSLCDMGKFHVSQGNSLSIRHDHRSVDPVLEFSNISGPTMLARRAKRLRGKG